MRWIYISPHLDDAALCAGGLIYDQSRLGQDVQIWTLLSGIPTGKQLTPYARVMHERWATTTAEQTVRLRQSEDRKAAEILEATPVHLGFLDAIYRTTADGEALYGDPVGAAVHPADEALVADIAAELKRRLRGDDKVVCLLGIGDHADHVIARQAAEATRVPLRYVADFPYVVEYPETIEKRVNGLLAEVHPISQPGLAAWIRAVESYASQLTAVFGDAEPGELIRQYWEAAEGIRLWTPRPGKKSGPPDSPWPGTVDPPVLRKSGAGPSSHALVSC